MAEPSSKTEGESHFSCCAKFQSNRISVKKRSHDQAGDVSASNPKESNRKRSNTESKPKKSQRHLQSAFRLEHCVS